MKSTRFFFFALCFSTVAAFGQEPQINPLEPAQITPPVVTPAPVRGVDEKAPDQNVLAAIKALEDLRAANIEIIQKQQATMQLLDQLAKDADQLRIFSKRG